MDTSFLQAMRLGRPKWSVVRSLCALGALQFLTLTVSAAGSQALAPNAVPNSCAAVFRNRVTSEDQLKQVITSLAHLKINADRSLVTGATYSKPLSDNYEAKLIELRNEIGIKQFKLSQIEEQVRAEIARIENANGAERARSQTEEDEKTRREKTVLETFVYDGRRMRFHPVRPHAFEMRAGGGYSPVQTSRIQLTEEFEMAATPVTQIVWRKVVEAGNKRPVELAEFFKKLNPRPSHFVGDLKPVEKVSREKIEIWLKLLNARAQLGDPIVDELMPDHHPGHIYDLPSEAQWGFVASGGGTMKGHLPFEDEALNDMTWNQANSDNSTHDVGSRLPLFVQGNEYFDLYGNVIQWTYGYSEMLPQGRDPRGDASGSYINLVGGSFNSNLKYMIQRSFRKSYVGDNTTGFRLIRTFAK